jgi:cysteinyl-tRNA synthetase
MSEKYLGEQFDIHGGGIDLKFPHHECEIAQTVACNGHDSVHYWMHNNMITINGQKMGKSLGNFITLDEFFTGSHEKLEKAYSPMTIRLFILMAHYRSTVDFSNEALQAAEKALERLLDGWRRISALQPSDSSDVADEIARLDRESQEAMDDDLNTPIVIAKLFEAASLVNKVHDGHAKATVADIDALRQLFQTYLFDILGIVDEQAGGSVAGKDTMEPYRGAVDLLLQIRSEAKAKKDWATSDLIRDKLAALGFAVKDTKNGAEWSLK